MNMENLVVIALVIAGFLISGFGIRMIFRRRARIRIRFAGNNARRTHNGSDPEYDREAFKLN